MKKVSFEDIVGYGSRVFVYCEKTERDSAETVIDIDFSESSFPEITIKSEPGKIHIRSNGVIEQTEILNAFKSVVKMLEA